MSMTKIGAKHGGKLTSELLPKSLRAEDMAQAKTLPTNHMTSSQATAAPYRANFHHGSIVPAYQRPSFRF